jgi:hypothetical protein
VAATQAYRDWVAAGRPYTLIRPAKALQAALRAHGLTVYDYPNDAHLQASTPEDHTPFSATGWPGTNRRWKARGLDVMPRNDSAAARKENANIARRLIRDRDAGVPAVMWIKYLNWTDENGVCRRVSWKPTKAVNSSTDKGHIHISGRSDADDDTRADGYDPLSPVTVGGLMTDFGFSQQVFGDSVAWRFDAAVKGLDKVAGGPSAGEDVWLVKALKELKAAAGADEVRDKAALAAVEAIAAAVKAGGGSIDVAAVIAAVNAVRDEARAKFAELAAQASEQAAIQESRIADLEEQLAHAVAAAEANLSPTEKSALDGIPGN